MSDEAQSGDDISAMILRWLPSELAKRGRSIRDLELTSLTHPRSGQSNETIVFEARWLADNIEQSEGFVLRLQPRDNQMFLDADVAREGRLIARIGEVSDVRVPRIHVVETSPQALGVPFFMMSKIEGRVTAGLPSIHLGPWLSSMNRQQRWILAKNAMDALASVHALDADLFRDLLPREPGKTALAADVQWLNDWYEWARRGREFPILDQAIDVIRNHVHRELGHDVLLWGDPRLGNTILSEDLSVAALIDWELASIGPPEFDVGWWLMTEEFARRGLDGGDEPPVPTRAEMIELYQDASGITLVDLQHFELIATVKLAITLLPKADLLVANGQLPPDSDFAWGNVPTQMVAALLHISEPNLSPDYRRFANMRVDPMRGDRE
jgi:aminoglycoside phosphotransferase (APT) family kinase protein